MIILKGWKLSTRHVSLSSQHDSFGHKNPHNRRPIRTLASLRDLAYTAEELSRQAVRNQAALVASTHARDRREATDKQAQVERHV